MFRNIETGEIIKAKGYAETFAFSHNSNYETYTEEPIVKVDNDSLKPKTTDKGKKAKENKNKTPKAVNEKDDKEPQSTEIIVDNYTREELIESLTALEIPFDENMSDDELLKLIEANDTEN